MVGLASCGLLQTGHAQVTIEVVSSSDRFEAVMLRDMDPVAARGGHFAHRAETGFGGVTHNRVIRRDGVGAVR